MTRAGVPKAKAWLAVGMALTVLPTLSGCIAAAVVPFVASAAVAARHKVKVSAATAASPSRKPKKAKQPKTQNPPPQPVPQVTITDLKELPPPDPPSSSPDKPWTSFADYAVAQTAQPAMQAALLAKGSSIDRPTRAACPAPHPAVVIDLDTDAPFAPDRPVASSAGLAAGLEKLRAAGVTILWISELPAARAQEVAAALKTAGLDPQGEDQLLLLRNADDRKQLLREDANKDVCIVAIAGDRRSDFDELFDYLRNPAAAVGLYPMMGSGWFLVPFPTAAVQSPDG